MGGDGYRPLTILLFSVQWVAGHGAPWVFHAVNILLYATVAVSGLLARPGDSSVGDWPGSLPRCSPSIRFTSRLSRTSSANRSCGSPWGPSARPASTFGDGTPGRSAGVPAVAIAALYAAACLCKENGIVLPGAVGRRGTARRPGRPARSRAAILRTAAVRAHARGDRRCLPVGPNSRPWGPYRRVRVVPSIRSPSRHRGTAGADDDRPRPSMDPPVSVARPSLCRVRTTAVPDRDWSSAGTTPRPPPACRHAIAGPGVTPSTRPRPRSASPGWRSPSCRSAISWCRPGVLIAERTLFMPSLGALFAIGGLLPSVETVESTGCHLEDVGPSGRGIGGAPGAVDPGGRSQHEPDPRVAEQRHAVRERGAGCSLRLPHALHAWGLGLHQRSTADRRVRVSDCDAPVPSRSVRSVQLGLRVQEARVSLGLPSRCTSKHSVSRPTSGM